MNGPQWLGVGLIGLMAGLFLLGLAITVWCTLDVDDPPPTAEGEETLIPREDR